MANVHPWFGGLAIDQAAGWTCASSLLLLPLTFPCADLTLVLVRARLPAGDFFEENDVVLAEAAPNKPTAYIAETGWPTESMTPDNATLGAAVAGVGELQTFLDTYPCQANANQSCASAVCTERSRRRSRFGEPDADDRWRPRPLADYFYFEPFDEPWKERFGGVEPVRSS